MLHAAQRLLVSGDRERGKMVFAAVYAGEEDGKKGLAALAEKRAVCAGGIITQR